MDSRSFFSRINSIREELDLPCIEPSTPDPVSLENYLVHRTSSDKETNTYLNHTFTAAGDTQDVPLTVETLQGDASRNRDQHRIEGLESQLREWMTFSKQKEEEVAQRYEQTISSLKKHYDEVALLYERNATERLKLVQDEHQKEVDELRSSWEETKSALKDYKKALADRDMTLDQAVTDHSKTKVTLEETKIALATARVELSTAQEQLSKVEAANESLQSECADLSSQVKALSDRLDSCDSDLSHAKENESQLIAHVEALQGDLKEKIQLIEELKTELVEQSKEVQKLVQASKELTEQRTSEREFIRKYREEIEGLENLKWQLEKETAELAAQKQQSMNEYVEEYEDRYQKAVSVAEMWKVRADFTLAKFYTFARSLRLEVITLKNEIVDWQETALTEFTKTVAQITRKYKFMLEDSQDYSLRMSEKVKKLRKGKKTGLY